MTGIIRKEREIREAGSFTGDSPADYVSAWIESAKLICRGRGV
jgi:hypothetical protein